jgi:hypothetical protein
MQLLERRARARARETCRVSDPLVLERLTRDKEIFPNCEQQGGCAPASVFLLRASFRSGFAKEPLSSSLMVLRRCGHRSGEGRPNRPSFSVVRPVLGISVIAAEVRGPRSEVAQTCLSRVGSVVSVHCQFGTAQPRPAWRRRRTSAPRSFVAKPCAPPVRPTCSEESRSERPTPPSSKTAQTQLHRLVGSLLGCARKVCNEKETS